MIEGDNCRLLSGSAILRPPGGKSSRVCGPLQWRHNAEVELGCHSNEIHLIFSTIPENLK